MKILITLKESPCSTITFQAEVFDYDFKQYNVEWKK